MTGAAVLAGQAAPGLVSVVAMPVIIRNAGAEAFGLYSLMLSSQVIVAISDLGLANTVLTEVPKARATGDRPRVAAIVRHALRLSCRVAGVLGLAAIVVFTMPISWSAFSGIPEHLEADASAALAVVLMLSGVNVFGTVLLKLRQAEGRAAGAYLLHGFGVFVGGVVTLGAATSGFSVPFLVLATLGPPAMSRLYLARGVRRLVAIPHQRSDLQQLSRRAGFFAFMQVAAVLAYQIDQLLLGALADLEEVAEYALVSRPIGGALLFVGAVSTLLWPYLSSAVALSDAVSIRRTMRQSIGFLMLISLATAALVYLLGDLLWELLGQGQITAPGWLVAGFLFVLFLRGIDSVTSTFLNAIPVVGFQLRVASLVLVSNVVVSILLVREYGAEGAIWGTVLTQAPVVTLPYLVRANLELRRIEHRAFAPLERAC